MPQWDEEEDELPGNERCSPPPPRRARSNDFDSPESFRLRWNFRKSGSSSFDLSGHHLLLEGAEMAEMPDKAATTNNFPDAKRTIIIRYMALPLQNAILMDSRQIDRRPKSVHTLFWPYIPYRKHHLYVHTPQTKTLKIATESKLFLKLTGKLM